MLRLVDHVYCRIRSHSPPPVTCNEKLAIFVSSSGLNVLVFLFSNALRRAENYHHLSRKGAKAQSAIAFLKGFLCAFAGKNFFQQRSPKRPLSTFRAKLVVNAKQ
jgi:hypothetical protein